MDRVVVVGSTSSGKSTLAVTLSELLEASFIELDALFWQPNWVGEDKAVFWDKVDAATSVERWVAAGNYSAIRSLTWGRADTIVWLDYPFPLVLWRLTKRTVWRVFGRVELWNGNRETFRNAFLSKNSLFLWLFKTHWSKRNRYESQIADEYPHLTLVHIRRPSEARWLVGRVSAGVGRESPPTS